jgi:hypothetical protein
MIAPRSLTDARLNGQSQPFDSLKAAVAVKTSPMFGKLI